MDDPHPPHKPEFGRTAVLATRLAMAALLAGAAVFVWRHHEVKPYSDPLNWLEFAADFRRQFTESKWPFGYPLFLLGMLRLLGPVWVFLSNLPLLLLLAWLTARLTRALCPGDPARAPLAGLAAAAFWVAVNPELLVQMANPYRDPLSHVLLIAGLLALLRFALRPGASPGWMALSGLALGYSYCVRETVVVILPVALLAGVLAWRRDRTRSFWKPALLFALGFALGALPFLVQGQLATGQVLVPVQSQKSGSLVPGMHAEKLVEMFPVALEKYWAKFTPAGWLLIAAGLVRLVRHRAAVALALLVGGGAGYFVFYSFYYTFVPRYFLVTDLFFAPLLGIGLAGLLGRVPGVSRAVAPAVVCIAGAALALLAAVPRARVPAFRVADARALAADCRSRLPAGALVVADRNLCEILRWLAPVESFSAEGLAGDRAIVRSDFGSAALSRRLAAGQPVFVCQVRAADASNLGVLAARDRHDLEPVWRFRPSQYNLGRVLPRGEVVLHRVQPWSARAAESVLEKPGTDILGLRLGAGSLWAEPGRTFARLTLNGLPLDDRVEDGQNLYALPPGLPPEGPWVLRLESDAPVPSFLDPVWVHASGPHALDLGVDARLDDGPLLGEGLRGLAMESRGYRVFATNAIVRIPTWWGTNQWTFACPEFQPLHTLRVPPAAVTVDSDLGRDARPFPYNRARQVMPAVLLPPATGPLSWTEIRVGVRNAPPSPYPDVNTAMAELDRVVIEAFPRGESLDVDFGTPRDLPFQLSGFHPAENAASGKACWSEPSAIVRLWLRPAGRPLRMRLTGHDHRPPRAPPASPRILLDEERIESSFTRAADGSFTLTAILPAGLLVDGPNPVTVTVAGWKPADYERTNDKRELGLLWDRLEVEPASP